MFFLQWAMHWLLIKSILKVHSSPIPISVQTFNASKTDTWHLKSCICSQLSVVLLCMASLLRLLSFLSLHLMTHYVWHDMNFAPSPPFQISPLPSRRVHLDSKCPSLLCMYHSYASPSLSLYYNWVSKWQPEGVKPSCLPSLNVLCVLSPQSSLAFWQSRQCAEVKAMPSLKLLP